MSIESPFWFLLLIFIFLILIFRKRLLSPIPFSFLLLTSCIFIILGLADINIRIKPAPREFAILVDNSLSFKLLLNNNHTNIKESLDAELQGIATSDFVSVYSFGDITRITRPRGSVKQTSGLLSNFGWSKEKGTNLVSGLKSCESLCKKSTSGGLVVLTDGCFTNDEAELENTFLSMRIKGVKLRLVLLGDRKFRNAGIIRIDSPQVIKTGDIAVFSALIKSGFQTKTKIKAVFWGEKRNYRESKVQLFLEDTPVEKDLSGNYEIHPDTIYKIIAWG